MLDSKAKGRISEMIKEEIIKRNQIEVYKNKGPADRHTGEEERFSQTSLLRNAQEVGLSHGQHTKTMQEAHKYSETIQPREQGTLKGMSKRASPVPDSGLGVIPIARERK